MTRSVVNVSVDMAWFAARQRVLRRLSLAFLLIILSGLLGRYGLHEAWGQVLVIIGLAVMLLGFAVAPLLHPKPLGKGQSL